LIQIMESMGIKFLGTIKDSASFPFEVVDIKTDEETVRNGRPVVQAYGSRTEHRAIKDGIVASVMRNGGGRTRVARIATNMPEAKRDGWVAEIEQQVIRIPHQELPSPLQHNSSPAQIAAHFKHTVLSALILITLAQNTPDWFIGRLFRFSSTSFHAVLSVKEAAYLNSSEIRDLHAECLQIVQLSPKSRVTVENAAYDKEEVQKEEEV